LLWGGGRKNVEGEPPGSRPIEEKKKKKEKKTTTVVGEGGKKWNEGSRYYSPTLKKNGRGKRDHSLEKKKKKESSKGR